MKKILTVILLVTFFSASAQWSNTSNYFEDSLHMATCSALQVQKNPIILTSYPDGGFFVIWEDERTIASTNTDIYAQKYDNAGNRLWAADGVPVSNGPNRQHYTISANQDYRNRSYAATDSAGGFYIAYSDDSVTNYVYERLMVQHIRSNGSPVFTSPGYIIGRSGVANLNFAPQLIADGIKGFFISYKYSSGNDYIYVYDYRDESGTLKFYGGGRVNENAIQTSSITPCGTKTDVYYPGTTVFDYNIWPDGQAGCNVIIKMNGNTGSQYQMIAYNRLFRAKKNAQTKTYFRNTTGTACPRISNYIKGDVYLLYTLSIDYQSVACGGGSGPVYAYTNYRLRSNGYQLIDQGGYDYNFPKGVTVSTTGNINVSLVAYTKRTYTNNILSNFTVQGYAIKSEIFDSIPYQRTSYSDPDIGVNYTEPFGTDKLNFFRDTILASSNYYPDFSLAAGGSNIFAASLMSITGYRQVRLQHLTVNRKAPDSFAVEYKTSIAGPPQKNGVAIGSEASDITYDFPLITVSKNGNALFYIREYYKYARVSPIGGDIDLTWGAMGRPIGGGVFNNSYYTPEQPFAALDSLGKSGLIAWKDARYIPGNTSSDNIYMRHLDKIDIFNYSPPAKRVRLLPNPYGPIYGNPAVMYGTSKKFSNIEVYDSYGTDPGVSPALDIYDNNYLGKVQVSVFQNSGVIRKYNGRPYLNRNITIKTDSVPPGAAIGLQLYFTKEDFNALKAADNTIADPGYLTVIRQPGTGAGAPATYTPVAGEELLTPVSWDSVPAGGYLVNLVANGTGNFFLQKIATVTLCSAAGNSFVSDVSGATYQWQVNTGSNFLSIGNDANYSGTTTATLHLTNIPSSFNGYRYRCVIDNTKVSSTFYLQVADSWTGAVSNLWEDPGNWSCGIIPDGNTDVVINSGNVILNSNSSCRSFKVYPGATFTVNPGFIFTVTH